MDIISIGMVVVEKVDKFFLLRFIIFYLHFLFI